MVALDDALRQRFEASVALTEREPWSVTASDVIARGSARSVHRLHRPARERRIGNERYAPHTPLSQERPPPRHESGTHGRRLALRNLAVAWLVVILAGSAYLVSAHLANRGSHQIRPAGRHPSHTLIGPPSRSRGFPSVSFSRDVTLRSDLHCKNLTIDTGAVVTSDGFNILCTGNVINDGTIVTGAAPLGSYPQSFGGSGGGGASAGTGNGLPGNSTRAPGGTAGINYVAAGGNGSTPPAPTMTASLLVSWEHNGVERFLSGASGGQGHSRQTAGQIGSPGARGILIEGQKVVAGTIDASGLPGVYSGTAGSGGGGGGGAIAIVYGPGGYEPGSYDVSGGAGSVNSGAGGAGQVLTLGTTHAKAQSASTGSGLPRAIYVGNGEGGSISVLNPESGSTVSTFQTAGSACSFVLAQNDSSLYATTLGGGDVDEFDANTGTVEQTIRVGGFINDIRAAPDGSTLYAVDSAGNRVVPIALPSGDVGTSIRVGTSPQDIAISPNGEIALVTNRGDGTVSVIQLSTRTVGDTLKVGSSPQGVAFLPNGKGAFVTDRSADQVFPIKIANGSYSVGAPIRVGQTPVGIGVSPDGQTLWVVDQGDNDVVPIDIQGTPTVEPGIPVGDDPVDDLAVSANGGEIYVTSSMDSTVSVISTHTRVVIQTFDVGAGPCAIALAY